MLIVMDKKATEEEIKAVVTAIEAKGYTARPIPGGDRVSIGVLNNKGPVDASLFLGYPGVKDVIPSPGPTSWSAAKSSREDTVIQSVMCPSATVTLTSSPAPAPWKAKTRP